MKQTIYQGSATTAKAPITDGRNQSSKRRRPIHARGNARTRGTSPLARTARPSSAAATGSCARSPRSTQRSDNSIAAENAAAIGKSVTPMWLKLSQPADVARIAVANAAGRSPNSRRITQYKKARNATLRSATGNRGARSSLKPVRNAVPIIQ